MVHFVKKCSELLKMLDKMVKLTEEWYKFQRLPGEDGPFPFRMVQISKGLRKKWSILLKNRPSFKRRPERRVHSVAYIRNRNEPPMTFIVFIFKGSPFFWLIIQFAE